MPLSHYKRPVFFFSISTIIPWCFWFGAGYVSHMAPEQDLYLRVASILGFVGLLTPMAVAYWLAAKDRDLRQDIAGRLFTLKGITPLYGLAACCLMLASILLAQAISLLVGYSPSQFVVTGHFSFSSGIFPVWVMLILAPIIEELAWHSYGTDCLRSRMNLFNASMLFGAFWGLWHVPLSTIRDYYQSNLVGTGWIHGVNFLVSIFPYVLLMNWLYYKTGRNILVAIVFHITAGYFNEIFATHPDSKIIQTVLLLVVAAIVVIRERRFFFDPGLAVLELKRPLRRPAPNVPQ